jgi:hypothetical protein
MATTNFTKDYILKRIDIRIVVLKRVLATAQADAEWVEEERIKPLQNWARAILESRQSVDEVLWEIAEGENRDRAHLRELYRRALGLAPSGNPGLGWDWERRQPQVDKIASAKRIPALEEELDRLEHARIYLEGTPVDSFSLTGLKQLGLLEAIKFDIRTEKVSV